MQPEVEKITEEALALPGEARAMLADKLVESLDPADDGALHRLWVEEAQRRLQEVRSGQIKTVPGANALEQVRRSVAR
ncbi:MAG: addiction module protein [Rhodanobacteraceae bacterium]